MGGGADDRSPLQICRDAGQGDLDQYCPECSTPIAFLFSQGLFCCPRNNDHRVVRGKRFKYFRRIGNWILTGDRLKGTKLEHFATQATEWEAARQQQDAPAGGTQPATGAVTPAAAPAATPAAPASGRNTPEEVLKVAVAAALNLDDGVIDLAAYEEEVMDALTDRVIASGSLESYEESDYNNALSISISMLPQHVSVEIKRSIMGRLKWGFIRYLFKTWRERDC